MEDYKPRTPSIKDALKENKDSLLTIEAQRQNYKAFSAIEKLRVEGRLRSPHQDKVEIVISNLNRDFGTGTATLETIEGGKEYAVRTKIYTKKDFKDITDENGALLPQYEESYEHQEVA